MIISVNWLKKFTDIDMPIDELATLIGARLVEIESVENLSEKYKDVIIAKIVECEPIKDSDHLNLTKIDDGGKTKDIERDDKGFIQVVCGAPNVKKGMTVAWLPPASIVPETINDDEPFVLGARKLRGFMSNGMLASSKELGLFEDHSGILDLDRSFTAGQSFAEALELDDYLLDIENKSLTHRPDTFGVIGFAREVAGIQNKAFTTPEWLQDIATSSTLTKAPLSLEVAIDDPELSDRYQAVVMSNAKESAQAPFLIQTYLARSGIRPINAIVDVTNYMMLVSGQPLHAFDYDKVLEVSGGKAEIHVRAGKKAETLALLDGRTIELTPDDIVIAAGDKAIALAGAMGGSETEIDESTKNIIVESATFNLYKLRSTQMRHGIFSEAITRFTKGQPAALTAPVLSEAMRMLGELAGVSQASNIAEAYPNKVKPLTIEVNQQTGINGILGSDLPMEAIVKSLENVEFNVKVKSPYTVVATAPYWRADIHIPEDIVEEVGRLNGFDSITLTSPTRDFTAVRPSEFDGLRTKLRALLVRAGANEALTYSFIHGDLMRKVGQNVDDAYRLTNSISPELQYYRQSLLPSLITHIYANVKAGYDHFALFELNKFHTKLAKLDEENVPKELDGLSFIVTNTKKTVGAPYFEAKRYMDYLAKELGLDLVYEPLEADAAYPVTEPFDHHHSARIWDRQTRERIGVIGEFKKSVQKAFKLPAHTAGFEISPKALLKLTQTNESSYKASSKFPSTERDICFQVAQDVSYQQIIDAAQQALSLSEYETSIQPLDLYQPADGSTKNITIRLKFASFEKTLTGDDATKLSENVISAVKTATNATIV
jgi:phenylalanyl-tRNA synthetase beta chain